jgi:hypothetical protein
MGQVRRRLEELQKDAKSLGVEIIDQDKLYDFMGYKKFSRRYELGTYTGGPEPANRFENPAQSTRPSGVPGFENPSAKGRPSGTRPKID